MKDVTVTYDLPTELTDGEALPASLIKHVIAEISADAGENWTEVDVIAADAEQKVFLPDLEKGDWSVALTVYLNDGRSSKATMVPFNVPSDAAPNEVSNIKVILE